MKLAAKIAVLAALAALAAAAPAQAGGFVYWSTTDYTPAAAYAPRVVTTPVAVVPSVAYSYYGSYGSRISTYGYSAGYRDGYATGYTHGFSAGIGSGAYTSYMPTYVPTYTPVYTPMYTPAYTSMYRPVHTYSPVRVITTGSRFISRPFGSAHFRRH